MTIEENLKRRDKAGERAIRAKSPQKWKKALKMFERYNQKAFVMALRHLDKRSRR